MSQFSDNNGRKWTLALDAPAIRKVRKACSYTYENAAGQSITRSVNLSDGTGEAYGRMADDPVLLIDVLWLLCEEQAEKANVSDVQFGQALVGDAIERATEAVLDAIKDFFPHAKRALMTAVAAKDRKIRELGLEKALAKINDPVLEARALAAMEARMDAELEESLRKISIGSSSATSSPDSAASNQKAELPAS